MSLSKENMNKVNQLVKAGRVDEARTLLSGLKGPTAEAALAKLNERYPPTISRPKSSPLLMGLIGVLCLVLIGAVGFLVIQRLSGAQSQTNAEAHRLEVLFEMQDACDEFHQRQETLSTVSQCDAEIEQVMAAHPDIVEDCFKTSSQVKDMMLVCLTNKGISFNG